MWCTRIENNVQIKGQGPSTSEGGRPGHVFPSYNFDNPETYRTLEQALSRHYCTSSAIYRTQEEVHSRPGGPHHVFTSDNSISPETYRTAEQTPMQGPMHKPQRGPESLACLHHGLFYKSCNLHISSWSPHARVEAQAPGRAEPPSICLREKKNLGKL